MTSTADDAPSPGKPRHRVSVVGVIGEVLITAGVFVLLFLGWQLWLQDILVGGQQQHAAQALTQKWQEAAPRSPEKVSTEPGTPIVMTAPSNATPFATLYVPRWGATWTRTIAQGVGTTDVLNKIG